MILNIRGTHGSGKSTIVHKLLKQFASEPTDVNKRGRPNNYKVVIEGLRKPVYIIGSYEIACGGCDSIQPYELIWPRVLKFARKGHVLFEGAIVSSGVGNLGRALAKRKDAVVLFLDTPPEVCVARIQKRRDERGDERPLNPTNTLLKHSTCTKSIPKFEELGVRVVMLSHKGGRAYNKVLEVLREDR